MMRDSTQWEPHRLLPEHEAAHSAIKVHQEPNHPPGDIRHLPKALKDDPDTMQVWSGVPLEIT